MTRRDVTALVVALACPTLLLSGTFRNQFVFDDVHVVGGTLIHDPARIGEVFAAHAMIAQGDSETTPMDTYRPLALVSFFWDAWISGHETWSYHLTNRLLHLAVVACVFTLARRLLPGAPAWVAGAAALFFGLSPQLAEAHVWINGRSDPMATLFGLLALLAWRAGEGPVARRLAAATLFFAGLLCKETLLLALPSLLLWPRSARATWRERLRDLLPFGGAALLYLALRSWALQGLHAAGGGDQVRRALANLPVLWTDGLSELLAPSRLYLRSLYHEYGLLSAGQRLVSALCALTGAWLLLRVRARARVLSWGVAWFACTLAPATMVSTVLWPGFGRFLYMPCVGLALGLGELLAQVDVWLGQYFAAAPAREQRARALGAVALGGYLVALALHLSTVAGNFADDKRLYLSAALQAPRPAYAYASYGVARANAGDIVGAIAPLTKALELAPQEPGILRELAKNLMRAGNPAKAEELLRSGIARSEPERAGDLRALLVQCLAPRDPQAAISALCECLHFQPEHRGCLKVPHLLLDPGRPRAADFRAEFARLSAICPSARARRALASVLGAP